MKTVKQIADEIGVDKQKVYRYIVRHGIHEVDFDSESGARNKTKYYDDQTVSEIMDAFHKSGGTAQGTADPAPDESSQDKTASDDHAQETASQAEDGEDEDEDAGDFTSFLMQQIEEKDRQIFNLQKLLDQEQRLHLQTQAALDSASRRIAAIEASDTKEDAKDSKAAVNDSSDPDIDSGMIHEVTPFEMKPVRPAPASEEEPATVQTVSEVLAQSAARREEEQNAAASEQAHTASDTSDTSDPEPIFHDTEEASPQNEEPPKKKGFWKRLFGL